MTRMFIAITMDTTKKAILAETGMTVGKKNMVVQEMRVTN